MFKSLVIKRPSLKAHNSGCSIVLLRWSSKPPGQRMVEVLWLEGKELSRSFNSSCNRINCGLLPKAKAFHRSQIYHVIQETIIVRKGRGGSNLKLPSLYLSTRDRLVGITNDYIIQISFSKTLYDCHKKNAYEKYEVFWRRLTAIEMLISADNIDGERTVLGTGCPPFVFAYFALLLVLFIYLGQILDLGLVNMAR